MPQTTTILKADGAEAGTLELADSLFGAPVIDPHGNVARKMSENLMPDRSDPRIVDTR